jgi:hypothetical protein
MIEIIKEVRKKINFPALDMRIGIHIVIFLYFFLKAYKISMLNVIII